LGGELNATFYHSSEVGLSSAFPPVPIVIRSSNPSIGGISVPYPFFPSNNSVHLTFAPMEAGETILTIEQPAGFRAVPAMTSFGVRVDAVPGNVFSFLSDTAVGQFTSKPISFSAGQPNPSGTIPVTIRSFDPSKLLVSSEFSPTPAASTLINARPGAPTLATLTGLTGQGAVLLALSAPGFAPHTITVGLTPAALAFTAGTSPPPNLRVNESFTVNATWFRLEPSTRTTAEVATYGIGLPLRAPSLTISNPNVIAVDGSPALTGAGVQFRLKAVGRGTSDVTIVQPPGFTEPASGTTVRITVP
jgi:hypothetical protein